MKKFFYPLMMFAALATTACTNTQDDITDTTDPSGKTPISFVGEATNAPAKTRAGFEAQTQIALHIRSTKDKDNIKETRTLAKASADAALSEVSFSNIDAANTDYVRYWDDAYGRDAKLSVFAIAVPSKTDATNGSETNNTLIDHLAGDATWKSDALSEEVTWVVSSDQSGANTIANEDLVYSNNIKDGGSNGVYRYDFDNDKYNTSLTDGCMKFAQKSGAKTEDPGKFDKGHLTFKHALSRVTINLIKGNGFGSDVFKFKDGTNVTIKSVPTSGTLNIDKGEWSTSDKTGISKMATTKTETGATYSLMAQFLPGYVIGKNCTDIALEFIIDDNTYKITQDKMFDALNNAIENKDKMTKLETDKVTMEQGLNYIFNINVSKSNVNVTASVVDFVNVTASKDMDNSHISVTLTENGTPASVDNYDWYRLNDGTTDISTTESSNKNWAGNYATENKATLTQDGTVWKTNWYFENNKSFYHFRAVNKNIEINANDTDADDYFDIHSGDQATHDYQWGAPMVNITANTLNYSVSDGYASEISPAIGATNDAIKLTMLHMMSNIKILLKTTDGDDKVNLAGSKVSISKYFKDGTVLMGNGKVAVSGSVSTDLADFTVVSTTTTTGEFTYSVVPQVLSRNTDDNIVITIETVDGNKYYIKDLSAIAENVSGGTAIARWLPGRNYTYTFTLTKTGITNVTASVQDWVNVTAEKSVTLE